MYRLLAGNPAGSLVRAREGPSGGAAGGSEPGQIRFIIYNSASYKRLHGLIQSYCLKPVTTTISLHLPDSISRHVSLSGQKPDECSGVNRNSKPRASRGNGMPDQRPSTSCQIEVRITDQYSTTGTPPVTSPDARSDSRSDSNHA